MRVDRETILALDYGTKKTGVAYSVENFAFSWKTIATRELHTLLPKMLQEKDATLILIGMPYNIDGSMSTHARRVMTFADSLRAITTIPIVFHDERLTSSEARIAFAESGIPGDIDAESARLILEDFLENK